MLIGAGLKPALHQVAISGETALSHRQSALIQHSALSIQH